MLFLSIPIISNCQDIKGSDDYLASILINSSYEIFDFSAKGLLYVAGGYDGTILNYKVFNGKVYIWPFNHQLQEIRVNSVGGGSYSERIEDPRPFSENNYIAVYGFKRLVDEKYISIKEKASFPERFWGGVCPVLPGTVSLKNDYVAGYKIDKNDIPNQFNPNTIFYKKPEKKTPIKFILRLKDYIEITSPSSAITYISSVICLTENQLALYSKSLANIGVNSSFYFHCRGLGSTIINNAKWYCVELSVNEQESIYAWTQNTNSNEPLNVVLSYYENINKKNYSAAYNMWHKTVSYNSFLDLYKDTQLILPLDAREASPGNWNLAVGIADSSLTWQGLYVGFETNNGVILKSSPGQLLKANALNIKTWRSDLNNSEIENILQATQWINPQTTGSNDEWYSRLSFSSGNRTNVDFRSYYIDSGLIYIYDNRDKNLLTGATYRLSKNSSATAMWRLDKVASSAEWLGADSFLSLQLPPSDGVNRLFGDYLIKCGDKPIYFNDRAAFRESPSSISFSNISNLENASDSKLWSCSPSLHYAEILSSKLAENKLIEHSTRNTIEWIGSTIINQKKWYLARLANTRGYYYYLWTDNLADDYPRIIYDYYIALNNKAFDLADSYRVQKKGNQFYLNNYTDCFGIFPISFRRGMHENTWIFNVAFQTSSLEKLPYGLSWLKHFKFYEVIFTINGQGIINSSSTELKDNLVY